MAKAVIMGGGGGGASSDELTAARGDVLKGKTAVTSDSSDEPVEGTLELTGDAADSHVLSGKTYYNKDPKTRRTGTMPNRGAVAQELAAGGSYTVPEGYHNGGGKVTANSLASQTGGATAADGDVLSGKTYWKDGAKRTGTMANQGAKTAALNAGGSYAIPAGYHNGSGKVTANSLASQTGGVTAADGDVLSGKTYWKDGAKRTGSMANRGALNVTLNPGGSQSVAAGYYSGGTIRANGIPSDYKRMGSQAIDFQISSSFTVLKSGLPTGYFAIFVGKNENNNGSSSDRFQMGFMRDPNNIIPGKDYTQYSMYPQQTQHMLSVRCAPNEIRISLGSGSTKPHLRGTLYWFY